MHCQRQSLITTVSNHVDRLRHLTAERMLLSGRYTGDILAGAWAKQVMWGRHQLPLTPSFSFPFIPPFPPSSYLHQPLLFPSTWSTIHEDHIDTPYTGTVCSSIVQFWQELLEKKHFKEKSMTSPLWRHPVTWRHPQHAQSIAHRQVPIGGTLKLSRYLASFPRYLAPKLRQWLFVMMTSSVTS